MFFLVGACIILALPLLVALFPQKERKEGRFWDLLANRTLKGVQLPHSAPALSMDAWWSGEFQRLATSFVGERFAFRELGIRLYNELLWTAFRKSYMARESVIAGEDGFLFENGYLYHLKGLSPKLSEFDLTRFVIDLAEIRDKLSERGIAFALLITPSKAIALEGKVPARFRLGAPPAEKRDYERIKPLLEKYGLPFVDGPALARSANRRLNGAIFPRNGTHWTGPLAALTADKLVETLRPQLQVAPSGLTLAGVKVDQKPTSPDDDLLLLLNLLRAREDDYVHAVIEPSGRTSGKKLTIVGGSFVHQLAAMYDEAGTWNNIVHYYYYKISKHTYPGGLIAPLDEDKIDWPSDFGDTSAVVLEVNESAFGWNHPKAFVAGIKRFLAAPSKAASTGDAAATTIVYSAQDWYGQETSRDEMWRWAKGDARIQVVNASPLPRRIRLEFNLLSFQDDRTIRIFSGGTMELARFQVSGSAPPSPQSIEVSLEAHETQTLRFSPSQPGKPPGGADQRLLAFAVHNLRLHDLRGVPDQHSVEFVGTEWFPREGTDSDWWRWAKGTAKITVEAPADKRLILQFQAVAHLRPKKLTLIQDGKQVWSGTITPDLRTTISEIFVPPGKRSTLQLQSDGQAEQAGDSDVRLIEFAVFNLTTTAIH